MPSCSMGFCVARTKNGFGQRERLALRRHVALLHRLEERGLRLRRRPVDLVREDDVGEDGPLDEAEVAAAGRRVLLDDLGARDVARHEVRRELDAREREVEGVRERADEERLGEARHAHEERVAAGEQRHEEALDGVVLPDDLLRDLGAEAAGRLGEVPGRGRVGRVDHRAEAVGEAGTYSGARMSR